MSIIYDKIGLPLAMDIVAQWLNNELVMSYVIGQGFARVEKSSGGVVSTTLETDKQQPVKP